MSSLNAGSWGIAAALVGTLAEASTVLAEDVTPETIAAEVPVAEVADPIPEAEADPLAPEPRAGEHELKTAAMLHLCDVRCQVLTLTEETIPGLGASRMLYTVLYPGKVGLSIPKADGTIAVTFTVMPTKLARGQGLVAKGTF